MDAERGVMGQGWPFATTPGAAPERGKFCAAKPGCRGGLLFGYFFLATQEKVTRRARRNLQSEPRKARRYTERYEPPAFDSKQRLGVPLLSYEKRQTVQRLWNKESDDSSLRPLKRLNTGGQGPHQQRPPIHQHKHHQLERQRNHHRREHHHAHRHQHAGYH